LVVNVESIITIPMSENLVRCTGTLQVAVEDPKNEFPGKEEDIEYVVGMSDERKVIWKAPRWPRLGFWDAVVQKNARGESKSSPAPGSGFSGGSPPRPAATPNSSGSGSRCTEQTPQFCPIKE
jgi:hypothetical protein